MELEKIALALRPRQGWEAVDLGFRMAMRWARPLWAVWFTVFLPVAGVLTLAFYEQPMIAALLVWWLKPLYDRYLLHVLSRAVFGATPSLRDTLGASRQILGSGLILSLFTRFIDISRSFNLPVTQLEGQRGASARARRRLLGLRAGAFAAGLTIVCIHFEWVVMYGLQGLSMLFESDVQWTSEVVDDALPWWETVGDWWGLTETLYYFIAISLIEPFYVAGGFALYLNRRVMLEAWDIELALKRLATRHSTALAMFFALTIAICAATPQQALADEPRDAEPTTQADGSESAPGDTRFRTDDEIHAGEAEAPETAPECAEGEDCADQIYEAVDTEIRREAHKILSEPAFGSEREVKRWKRIDADDEDDREPVEDAPAIFGAIAELLRVIAYLAIAAIVVALIYALLRFWLGAAPSPVASAPPAMLFGLAINPESLPEDVPAAARALLAAGQRREALSLLYRGALSNLVHTRGMRIGRGATEGDVLRLAQSILGAKPLNYLRALINTWSETAYAARLPEIERIDALCSDYVQLVSAEASV